MTSEEAKTNKIVLKTPNDQRVLVSEKEDESVYHAPCEPTGTGQRFTRGVDLLRHRSRSGNIFYYFHEWSMWQRDDDSYELCTPEEAMKFLGDKLCGSRWVRPTPREQKRIAELFPELLTETA